MKRIQEAALVAEVVGALGVVLSLVFVGIQLKGNSTLLEAQAVFELRESNSLMSRDMIGNDVLAELVYRGHDDYDSLTDFERWRYRFWVDEVLTHRMTAWKYSDQELLDAAEMESWRDATCDFVVLPGPRRVWGEGGPWLRTDFREYVERTCFGPEASS